MTDINDLLKERQNLDMSSVGDDNPTHPNERRIQALKATQFTIFETIADLGYFGWESYISDEEMKAVTIDNIKKSIHVVMKAPIVAPLNVLNSKLPICFSDLPPRESNEHRK